MQSLLFVVVVKENLIPNFLGSPFEAKAIVGTYGWGWGWSGVN